MKYFSYSNCTTISDDLKNFKQYKRLNVNSRVNLVKILDVLSNMGLKSNIISELQKLSHKQLTKILKINPELLEFVI